MRSLDRSHRLAKGWRFAKGLWPAEIASRDRFTRVMSTFSIENLKQRTIVVIEHPSEPLAAIDRTAARHLLPLRTNQAIGQPLMIALRMIQIKHRIPISSSREKYYTPGILGMVSGCGFTHAL